MATDARLGMIVFDTPDPAGLAAFWQAVLGWAPDPDWSSEDWVTIRGEGAAPLGFQLAPELPRSSWPGNDVPQQAHLDVFVSDMDAVAARVAALGATRLDDGEDSPSLRIFADPSGHPFCLCAEPAPDAP